MNVAVNPKDHVVLHTMDNVPKGFVIVETATGFHYISDDKVYFMPRTEAEEMIKRERVRGIFGLEE